MSPQAIAALVLVFAAVVVITYVFAGIFFRETAIKAEESINRGGAAYDPVSRFIRPDFLIQLRFAAAFLLGGCALTILLFLRVSAIAALVIGTLLPAVLGFYAILLHFRRKARRRARDAPRASRGAARIRRRRRRDGRAGRFASARRTSW